MRPYLIVVLDVLLQQPQAMALIQYNNVVEALATERLHHPFAIPLACGQRYGVSMVSIPIARARATKDLPKLASRS